jgi:hypothetical protein
VSVSVVRGRETRGIEKRNMKDERGTVIGRHRWFSLASRLGLRVLVVKHEGIRRRRDKKKKRKTKKNQHDHVRTGAPRGSLQRSKLEPDILLNNLAISVSPYSW